MNPNDLQKRTKRFAVRIIKLVQHLEKLGTVGIVIGKQILRSGTSVAANYRAVCRAKSAKDFIHKLGTVVEESDETQFWLELLVEAEVIKLSEITDLLKEASEITAIMTASKYSAIKNQRTK
ncbi:MAG TPA: four helix bundle protein [Candidatus Limnocylindria bacterium]|nr:four helix bundle protein [Candidatus Limnocylindria bacterium]